MENQKNLIKENSFSCEQVNDVTRNVHVIPEIHSSFGNHTRIMSKIASGEWKDLAAVKDRHKGEPVVIVGSGPSLDRAIPYLKEWKGKVICSTSQASTLLYHGINPDYIVALDRESYPDELLAPPEAYKNSTLVLHPGVDKPLVDWWDYEALLFRKAEPQVAFYANAQNIGYSLLEKAEGYKHKFTSVIKAMVIMFSSVAPAELFVGKYLGFDRFFLCGLDFGMPFNQDRFTRYLFIDGEWQKQPVKTVAEALASDSVTSQAVGTEKMYSKIIYSTNGIPTYPMHLFYKTNFITAWRLDKTQVIDCSAGTLTEFPKADIKEVVKRQGRMGGKIKGFSQQQMIDSSELYLARNKLFVFQTGVGPQFVQTSKDSVAEIQDYINSIIGHNIEVDKKGILAHVADLMKKAEKEDRRIQFEMGQRYKIKGE